MTPAILGLGALCAFPIAAILALRYAGRRNAMDGRARKKLLGQSIAFTVASLAVSISLVWARGRLAAPAMPEAIAVLATALLLVSSLFGKRDRR
jgi:hypothetical protein